MKTHILQIILVFFMDIPIYFIIFQSLRDTFMKSKSWIIGKLFFLSSFVIFVHKFGEAVPSEIYPHDIFALFVFRDKLSLFWYYFFDRNILYRQQFLYLWRHQILHQRSYPIHHFCFFYFIHQFPIQLPWLCLLLISDN